MPSKASHQPPGLNVIHPYSTPVRRHSRQRAATVQHQVRERGPHIDALHRRLLLEVPGAQPAVPSGADHQAVATVNRHANYRAVVGWQLCIGCKGAWDMEDGE